MTNKPAIESRPRSKARPRGTESVPVTVLIVDDEDVVCPFCGSKVFTAEEPMLRCRHVAFVYSWTEGFESATDEVLSWWKSLRKAVKALGRTEDSDDLCKCPHIQYLVVHNSRGIACGPVCFSTSYGFSSAGAERSSQECEDLRAG